MPKDSMPALNENNASIDRSLDILQAGGPVLWLLFAMSILMLCIAIVKLIQFKRYGVNHTAKLKKDMVLWQLGKKAEAIESMGRHSCLLSSVLSFVAQQKMSGASESLIKEEAARLASDSVDQVRSKLKVIEIIATLSPLLGLLGTVLGMITAFQELQSAGDSVDPSILSGGIWEALITTAAGLCVAIPSVAVLNYLEQKAYCFQRALEDNLTFIFTSELYKP